MRFGCAKYRLIPLLILLTLDFESRGQQYNFTTLSLPSFAQETIRLHKNNVYSDGSKILIQNSELIALHDLISNQFIGLVKADSTFNAMLLLEKLKKSLGSSNMNDMSFSSRIDGLKFISSNKSSDKLYVVLSGNFYYYYKNAPQKMTSLNACFLVTFNSLLIPENYFVLPLYSDHLDIAYAAPFAFDKRDSSFIFPNSLLIDSNSNLSSTRIVFSKIKLNSFGDSYITHSLSCDSTFKQLIGKYLNEFEITITSPEICSKQIRFIPPVMFLTIDGNTIVACDNEIIDLSTCKLTAKLAKDENIRYIQSIILKEKIYSIGWSRIPNGVQYYLSTFDLKGNLIESNPIKSPISKLFQYKNGLYILTGDSQMTATNHTIEIQVVDPN